MKRKRKDEYKCLVNFGAFVIQISVSVIMLLIAIIFVFVAIETKNTKFMVIEWIAVILCTLLSFLSIFSAVREAKQKFIIDKNFCILFSRGKKVCISVFKVERIEIVNVFRGAKKIVIYAAAEVLPETLLDVGIKQETISLQYSRKRAKRIQQYCQNSKLIYTGWD